MRAGIEGICAALGLGAPCDPPEPVAGGSSAECWRVRTARGRWLVKVVRTPAAWQLHEMRVSGRLERAAYEAGVPMPAPAEPARPAAAGYWARLSGDGSYARASAWVYGSPPGGSATGRPQRAAAPLRPRACGSSRPGCRRSWTHSIPGVT